MRGYTLCLSAALLSQSTAAHPSIAVPARLSEPAADVTPIPVIGVKTGLDNGTGKPPPRLNIDQIYGEGGPQWYLYVQALAAMQETDETDEQSYFAITGIHGLPHSAWNGVDNVDGAPITGFCPHGEDLFTIWHRPYVALFEQVLVSHAISIAETYPPNLSPEYLAAAHTLRQPFWDWASDSSLPIAAIEPFVSIIGPQGEIEVRNPLYSYHFQRPEVEASFGGFLATRPDTIRCLDSEGGNNWTASNEQLASVAKDLTRGVYDIFSRTPGAGNWRASQFENPHNSIHMKASCSGTLEFIDWSAFEPLFMLHHTNVDRLVAIWQTINYDEAFFSDPYPSKGQFGTPKGTIITADSPLKPFFDENQQFHTSRSVANVTMFGYTYPELPDWSLPAETRASQARALVNAVYAEGANELTLTLSQSKLRGQEYLDYYTAEVSLNRSEIPLPAILSLVVGGEVVGRMTMLAAPTDGTASASLPLQDVQVGNESARYLPTDVVVPFLLDVLAVDIRRNDGTEVPVAVVPSLVIEVQDIQYLPRANDSSFASFGNATSWFVDVRQA